MKDLPFNIAITLQSIEQQVSALLGPALATAIIRAAVAEGQVEAAYQQATAAQHAPPPVDDEDDEYED